jgi:hypothetical protein
MVIDVGALAAICALQFILKIPFFKLPLDRDFGAHAYIADCWLKGRGLLYRDLFCSKTPGLKIIYMIIIKWFGISRKSFRLFFALYSVLTTIAVYALGATLFSPTAGLVAAGLFGFYSSVPSLWWHFSNMEAYYVLPMVLSFLGLAQGSSASITAALLSMGAAGFFGGIAFMFKQPALINTVAPALFYLILFAPHGPVVDIGVYCAGFSLPCIALVVYFVMMHKTPWEKLPISFKMGKIIWRYCSSPLFKANRNAIEANRRRFKGIFYDTLLLCALGFGGALAVLASGNSPAIFLVPWLALAFLTSMLGRTYLAYHFIPPIMPMCVLGGMAIQKLFSSASSHSLLTLSTGEYISFGALGVLSILFVYHLIKDLLLPAEFMGMLYSGEDQLYATCEEAGKYIKSMTTEKDYVYSWGAEAEIYLFAERKTPVYSIYPPIVNPPLFSKDDVAKEFAELLTNKPTYFALTFGFNEFKQFEQLVVQNYVLEKKFEPFVYLFKLK